MRISEIFHSIQGEGQFVGTPSVFVRTTGCNLRCWFCDTDYTSWNPEGEHLSLDTILDRVRAYECEHVVVTGGEPFLQREIVPLTQQLAEDQHIVTIETAGTVFRSVHADLISLSPKLANSTPQSDRWTERHERDRDQPHVIEKLISSYPYQLKFVIDKPEDLNGVAEYLQRYPDVPAENVWLMPQSQTQEEYRRQSAWLKLEAERLGFRFSPRLHIEMFGNERGK
jgi:7-carboxy-7-deazaguanine synthase